MEALIQFQQGEHPVTALEFGGLLTEGASWCKSVLYHLHL